MKLTVRGPWVLLGRAHSAGDELAFDLDRDELLTLWNLPVDQDDLERVVGPFRRARPGVAGGVRVARDGDAIWLASPVAGVRLGELLRNQSRLPRGVALRICADLSRGYAEVGRTLNAFSLFQDCVGWDGVARAAPDPSRFVFATRGNYFLSRPRFHLISPEAARALPYSDAQPAWSVGALAYFLFSGAHAAEGDSEFALLNSIVNEPRPRLADTCPELPSEISDLVDRCLLFEPEARPSLEELAASLERLGAAGHDEVAELLASLYADTLAYIEDTVEMLRAAPPAPEGSLVVLPAPEAGSG